MPTEDRRQTGHGPRAALRPVTAVAMAGGTPLIRHALGSVISAAPAWHWVGDAGDASGDRGRVRPQVLLIDSAVDPAGLLIRRCRLRSSGLTVVVLVAEPQSTVAYRDIAMNAGAHGLVSAASHPRVILTALYRAHTAGRSRDGTVASPQQQPPALAVAGPPLSAREHEVVSLLAEGLQNRAIAGALHLSTETIRTHVKNILRKLDAADRAHAVSKAYRLGLLSLYDHAERRDTDAVRDRPTAIPAARDTSTLAVS